MGSYTFVHPFNRCGTLLWDSQRYLLVTPFGPFWVCLSMSAEQIASKWSFRLVGNTLFGPSQMEVLRWCGGPHER